MSGEKQNFEFERASLALSDGTLFRPETDADERWVRARPSQVGLRFEILYQHKDGRFILVYYADCLEYEAKATESEAARRFWRGIVIPCGQILTAVEAARLVRDWNGTPSAQLVAAEEEAGRRFAASVQRRMAEESTPEPIQPAEFWKDKVRSLYVQHYVSKAHEVDLRMIARAAYLAVVEMVQSLRSLRESSTPAHLGWINWFTSVRSTLFTQYGVDPDDWWGALDEVPPRAVCIYDLPWPRSLKKASTIFRRLAIAIEMPCYCLAASESSCSRWEMRHDKPHQGELAAANEQLIVKLPLLEQMVGEIGLLLRQQAILGRKGAAPAEEPELPSRLQKALNSYNLAEENLKDRGATKVTDDEAHAWLTTHGSLEYDLPELNTWKRYLRDAREMSGQRKNLPRAGRTGRSIVRADELGDVR